MSPIRFISHRAIAREEYSSYSTPVPRRELIIQSCQCGSIIHIVHRVNDNTLSPARGSVAMYALAISHRCTLSLSPHVSPVLSLSIYLALDVRCVRCEPLIRGRPKSADDTSEADYSINMRDWEAIYTYILHTALRNNMRIERR